MNTGIIPMRYAKTLLAFATEQSASEEVYREMTALARSYALEPALKRTMDNPMLSHADKAALVRSAIGERVSETTQRFVDLVIRMHREEYLQSMALMYLDLYRKANNISVASLETAVETDKQVEERIRAMVAERTKGSVELKTTVDPKLIGGFVFELDFHRLDASVASQLNRIRNQFIEKNKRVV